MSNKNWEVIRGEGPILATAIHNGHQVRESLAQRMSLSDSARLQEEDPFTGRWTEIVDNRIILNTSRFEVDLNRPREKAVYATPADCWGLKVWHEDLEQAEIESSLSVYDSYYAELRTILEEMKEKHGTFVVYDIHNYNHRRNGPDAPPEDPELNPQVNLGTGSMNKQKWGGIVDAFMNRMASYNYPGGNLDVRENVKFKGGYMSQWIHQEFPESGCCLAIEFKKFFMDEWTGTGFEDHINHIKKALQSTIQPVLDELKKVTVG